MSFSRRSFLVICGGTLLGTFGLPEAGSATEESWASTAAGSSPPTTPTSPVDRIRKLLTPPTWDEDRTVMVWVEDTDDDSGIMVWTPETPEEWEEAERFYAAATHRTWHTFAELKAQPLQPGKFVIRWIMLPQVSGYLLHCDDSVLFSGNEELEMFGPDPGQAATFSHARAIELIPRLMADYEFAEDSESFFDTIPLANAVQTFEAIAAVEQG